MYIMSLYDSGILAGSSVNGSPRMSPNTLISKQEAVTLLGRILGKTSESQLPFPDAASVPPWAYRFFAWFAENGFLDTAPNENLNPRSIMTTAALADLVEKAYMAHSLSNGMVQTLIGTGSRGHIDGGRQVARFTLPYGMALDKDGNVFIFDTFNNAIRKFATANSSLETTAGKLIVLDEHGFSRGYYLDGDLKDALMNRPACGAFNSNGELIFADSGNHTIRIIRASNRMYTLSGTTQGFQDGSRDIAMFDTPMAVAIDGNDYVYVADTLNHCIRKIDTSGNVTTIAGVPGEEGSTNGDADRALLRTPSGIAVNADGSVVYVADTGNHRIVKITDGRVTTVAGRANGVDDDGDPLGGYAAGSVSTAMFNLPTGLALAGETLIIADKGNNMIRAIIPSGRVITVAGTSEPGDQGGHPREAMFNQPHGVYYRNGILYITDTVNNKVKTMPFNPWAY
jgi:DNA-binding beta-propeller fold protein YncE